MQGLIVGVGAIALEYAKILTDLKIEFKMVGRDSQKAEKLKQQYGYDIVGGGLKRLLESGDAQFDFAINAVQIENLFSTNLELIQIGKIKKILCEKPGALAKEELSKLTELCQSNKVDFKIAYNRRYFQSVVTLQRILEKEKCSSIFFEFTEWFWRIDPKDYSAQVMDEWLLCNSTHVIDLAFHLGAGIKELNGMTSPSQSGSGNQAQYVGHGLMKNGALCSYYANWESAGRWRVEVFTTAGRYLLCPMEKLFFQKRGTMDYVEIPLESDLDVKYKPGYFLQVQDFVVGRAGQLKDIEQQYSDYHFFQKIKN